MLPEKIIDTVCLGKMYLHETQTLKEIHIRSIFAKNFYLLFRSFLIGNPSLNFLKWKDNVWLLQN
jgi:hypothetical protein